MSLSSAVKKRLVAAALGVGLSGTMLMANESTRCVNCGECSGGACGFCVYFATTACCNTNISSNAYAVCDGGEWFGFCQGAGGPLTYCGYY